VKKIVFILLLVLLPGLLQAATLGDLLWQMNQRINEDTSYALIPDTAKMLFLDMAQYSISRNMDYLPKRVDVSFSLDSIKYALPSDFVGLSENAVMALEVISGVDTVGWSPVWMNPGFRIDTTATTYQYFIAWETSAQAEIYLKGTRFLEGQTIRIFYRAWPSQLTARTDTVSIPVRDQVLVVQEAVSYYKQAQENYAAFQLLWNMIRSDMGIGVQEKQ